MDFKKQLESELDKRYVDMLKGSSKPTTPMSYKNLV